ncbi:MAG: hypothetical protein V3Q69_11300 [Burkholderia sp.]
MLHKSSMRTQWNGLRTSLVCNPFISLEIMPVDAIASSRSIYATTPLRIGISTCRSRPFGMLLILISNFQITNCGSICNNA